MMARQCERVDTKWSVDGKKAVSCGRCMRQHARSLPFTTPAKGFRSTDSLLTTYASQGFHSSSTLAMISSALRLSLIRETPPRRASRARPDQYCLNPCGAPSALKCNGNPDLDGESTLEASVLDPPLAFPPDPPADPARCGSGPLAGLIHSFGI